MSILIVSRDEEAAALLCAAIVRSGRPLVWKTVRKSTMAGNRNSYEVDLLDVLGQALPTEVRVTVLADRGFGDQKLYEHLAFIGWDYVIRFRDCILVTCNGETKPAAEWVPPSGHAKILKAAAVTGDKTAVPAVVVEHAKGMKEAWCLATSRADDGAAEIVKLYSRRFTIEETFRDEKDIRPRRTSATPEGATACYCSARWLTRCSCCSAKPASVADSIAP